MEWALIDNNEHAHQYTTLVCPVDKVAKSNRFMYTWRDKL